MTTATATAATATEGATIIAARRLAGVTETMIAPMLRAAGLAETAAALPAITGTDDAVTATNVLLGATEAIQRAMCAAAGLTWGAEADGAAFWELWESATRAGGTDTTIFYAHHVLGMHADEFAVIEPLVTGTGSVERFQSASLALDGLATVARATYCRLFIIESAA